MKNPQNNAFCSAFPGPSTKVEGRKKEPWSLHFLEIIPLPKRVSRKFACVSLSKTFKILLVPPRPYSCCDPDFN